MPNVLISSETGSEWQISLEHPQPIECMSIYVLSLAHGRQLRCSDVYLHIVKKVSGHFFFKFSQGTCPWMAFACCFFYLKFFLGGSVGQTM